MSGGGKGGSQTTSVEIPDWLEDAARTNMARADEVAQTGYVPYMGPDVAAMTPMQQAAMQNTGGAASAFGMSAPSDPMAGMPQAQEFAGGVQGYSSAPLYEQSLAALQESAPAQYDHITGMFIDPVTGAPARSPFGSGAQPGVPGQPGQPGSTGQPFQPDYSPNVSPGGTPGGGFAPNGDTASIMGGYSGLGDMTDGGGPGASGDTFQGGGLFSGIGNAVTSPSSVSGGGGFGGGK